MYYYVYLQSRSSSMFCQHMATSQFVRQRMNNVCFRFADMGNLLSEGYVPWPTNISFVMLYVPTVVVLNHQHYYFCLWVAVVKKKKTWITQKWLIVAFVAAINTEWLTGIREMKLNAGFYATFVPNEVKQAEHSARHWMECTKIAPILDQSSVQLTT